MPPELPSSSPEPVRLRSVPVEQTPPEAVALGPPRALPKPLTSLIGRDAEVAAVRALILDQGVRLVTLTGPGGVGKTRLALRVGEAAAAAFPDGVVFVPLAAIADHELVLPTVARALGLREDPARSAAALLADALRHRRLLLVLDNFEQVRASAARVAALLAACPDLVVLVTSRALLHIAGEQRFPVSPLALPGPVPAGTEPPPATEIAAAPAVQLFVARAQAIDPAFALDEGNAAAIAAICRRLDGLPLAIELAAARVHVLSPAELLDRLGPMLPLLTGGAEDAPDRLRTMRAAIAWSHDLLSPAEQALFRRLAIFVGGFPLEAAEWVSRAEPDPGHPTPDTLDLIASLIDKSLLQRIEGHRVARFGMLETIREFGLERLAASGEHAAITARHASWCVNLAKAVRRSGGLSQGQGLAALEAEHPNLRAALEWFLAGGEVTAAQDLAGQLAEFWLRHCHLAEGRAWLERVLAVETGEPTGPRAEALVGLSMHQWPGCDFARAAKLAGEAETVARDAGDAGALAYARLHQGYVAAFAGDNDLALARGEEALTTCEAIPQRFSCNGAIWLLARTTLARGEDNRASEMYEQLLATSRAAGDEISVANGLVGQAFLAERLGDLDRALNRFVEAATICQRFGDVLFVSLCLNAAAVTAVGLGRPEPAVRLFAAVATLHTAIGAVTGPGLDVDWQHQEQAHAAALAALGEERFAAAWAAGASLGIDEAIAEAAVLARLGASPTTSYAAASLLTTREREVLRGLVCGWSDKEIAAALGIGRRTVSNHVAAIRAKLDAPSRTAAAAIAVRGRLV